jgi:hypothetical protein
MAGSFKLYYEITVCCPEFGTQITFFNSINGNVLNGTYSWEGTDTVINGILFKNEYCYTVTRKGTSLQNYPVIDKDLLNPIVDGCTDPKCPPCPIYYTLNDCCTNEPIDWPPNNVYGFQGTLYLEFDGNCNEGDFDYIPCPNDLTNLVITEISNEAVGGIFLEGCLKLTRVSITEIPSDADTGPWNITMEVVSTVPTCAECQECCYKLTNCQTNEVIYSNSNTLGQHFGNTVTLNGQEGCWTVALSEGDCTCPIPVTVLQSFEDCPSCVPIIAYKFTNCNNQALVQYSTEDYSEYIGKTVELECGGCWFVSQIDYTPPSTQTITILFTFDSCLICNRTYYKLVDCLDPAVNIVYTYTDLSQYLGKTIKIKGCDSCFTVLEETREPINPGIVEVTDSYIDCPECLVTFPCVCNRLTNQDTIAKDFTYIDCLFEEVTINLQPNETSEKVCLINWVLTPEEEALVYIEHFGDCNSNFCYEYYITLGSNTTATLYYKNCSGNVESQQILPLPTPRIITICGVDNQTLSDIYIVGTGTVRFEKTIICATLPVTCPVEPLPKRKVKPGYSTPSCDIEKYEKITCKASEIYYKQVMRLRYGISNCCPEDEEKWLIKKELIDLDALRDPDYVCTPVTSCCGQTIETCGCGCNQTLKTCNS